MSRGVRKWSEEVITRMEREGRGKGRGATYLPWILTTDFYSRGRTHELYSHKTRRSHQLLSDAERNCFVMLEWSKDIVDIREQYPLDRDASLEVAKEIKVRHPYYPGAHVPAVMTLDFLVTRVVDGKDRFSAYSVKTAADLETPAVIERLELERDVCQRADIPYHLVVKEQMPKVKVANLLWIRDAQLDKDAIEPHEGFYEEHMSRMFQDLSVTRFDGSLVDYCSSYDRRCSVEPGTGLRVARMLMSRRALTMDLNNPDPRRAHMDTFQVSALPGRLRSVAGGGSA